MNVLPRTIVDLVDSASFSKRLASIFACDLDIDLLLRASRHIVFHAINTIITLSSRTEL